MAPQAPRPLAGLIYLGGDMKPYFLIGVIGCALMTDAAFAQSPATKIAPQKGWLNDLDSARTQALKTGKPMMVVFRCDP